MQMSTPLAPTPGQLTDPSSHSLSCTSPEFQLVKSLPSPAAELFALHLLYTYNAAYKRLEVGGLKGLAAERVQKRKEKEAFGFVCLVHLVGRKRKQKEGKKERLLSVKKGKEKKVS